MSTDWIIRFDKDRFLEILIGLKNHKYKVKETFYRHDKSFTFAFASGNGNASFLCISPSGSGYLTRYAGTSPENLSVGFEVVETIIKPTEFICEYDIQAEEDDV